MPDKKNAKKKGKKKTGIPSDIYSSAVDDLSSDSYSLDEFLGNSTEKSLWNKFKKKIDIIYSTLKYLISKTHKNGIKRITIMLIPHTEKRIINWHVTIYTIFLLVIAITFSITFSVISLADKSGDDIQFYDMGLGNREFGLQATQIAEESISLHKLIRKYTNTIAELFIKLGGKKSNLKNFDSNIDVSLSQEIEEFRTLIQKCRLEKEKCEQKVVEEILKKNIYLSSQDNYSLKKTIALAKQIKEILNTKEKRELLENTPSLWPTQGSILSPYGAQTDALRGRPLFKRGIEINALLGTAVIATAPGKVTSVSHNEEYGLNIYIKHKYGIGTFYAHLDRANIKIDDKVSKGEIIGYVGQTGSISIPLLYYEVHVGTVTINPYAFINHLQNPWIVPPKI